MKDQVENLNSRTKSPTLAATLNGLQTMIERRDVLDGSGWANMRFCTFRLSNCAVRLSFPPFASGKSPRGYSTKPTASRKWGHDFRPDYFYAARFIRGILPERRC